MVLSKYFLNGWMDDVRMNMGLKEWEHLERTRHSGIGSDGGSQPSQGVETGTHLSHLGAEETTLIGSQKGRLGPG